VLGGTVETGTVQNFMDKKSLIEALSAIGQMQQSLNTFDLDSTGDLRSGL
jgi:hypothetical protein